MAGNVPETAITAPMVEKTRIPNPEALYESLFEGMLDGVAYCQMVFDAQGHPVDFLYKRVNRNFQKLTGLKRAEGKKASVLIPGIRATNPELFEIYGRVAQTGTPERFETYVKPLDKWFTVSAFSPVKNFFVAVFQDVTGRKRIEQDLENAKIAARNVLEDLQMEKETLAHAKAKDEAMLTSIGDGLVTTDTEGRIILVNQAFERILGWGASEVRGQRLTDMVPMTDDVGVVVPEKERLTERCMQQKVTMTGVKYYKKKDGSIFPVAITISPILLDGEFLGIVEVFRDISKETDIDRAKTEFVSLASHQLKTPLTTIGWYTEMLLADRAGPLTEKGHTYLEKISHNNHRMVGLVNALLNVSRIDMGTLALAPQPVCLVEAAESVLEEFFQQITQKKLRIEKHFSKNLPLLNADPQLTRIIFQNLLSNAVKFSSDGGQITITITVRGADAFIQVSDMGCGIPKAQQSKIFTKLFRADNAREKDADGTGLGLYIVKAVVEQSRGHVWFESTENKGTVFFVTLPLKGMEPRGGTKGLV